MNVFYIPETHVGSYVSLPEEESKHCIKVLRLKQGETLSLIDGKGGFYTAIISEISSKKCEVEIIEHTQNFGKLAYNLHIAIAPTKNNDRLEWFVEKATEIGISEITPIITSRSERKIIKTERLEKVMVAAAKQSLKAYFPKINQAQTLKLFLQNVNSQAKFIAHCAESKRTRFKDALQTSSDLCVLIGPEGDFTSEEIVSAEKAGFNAISLGNSRLRTETAGIVACHTVALFFE